MQNPLKIHLVFFGLPLTYILLSLCISFSLSFFLYNAFTAYLVLSILVSFQVKSRYLKHYQSLYCDVGSPIKQHILVDGLPNCFLQNIIQTIEDNRLVVVSCPKHPFLRKSIAHFIYNKAGFVQFTTSPSIALSSKTLGNRTFLLSYRSKKVLQEAITHLVNRGWTISGEQGSESNLVDRVYTQRMTYNPS